MNDADSSREAVAQAASSAFSRPPEWPPGPNILSAFERSRVP